MFIMHEQFPDMADALMAYLEESCKNIAKLALAHNFVEIEGSAAIDSEASNIIELRYVLPHSAPELHTNSQELTYPQHAIDVKRGIFVNKNNFYDFAIDIYPAHASPASNRKAAGHTWNGLCRVYYYSQDGKRSGLHARLRSQRIEVPLKFIKPPLKPHLGDGENLELASIIELMNNYDLFHKQNPLYSGSQILGRDTSIGVVDFLRRYIDYHIEQPLALTLF